MPFQREAKAILADWHAVQRDTQAVKAGIADGQDLHGELKALHAEARRLRDEYRRLVDHAIKHRTVLPPFGAAVGVLVREPGRPPSARRGRTWNAGNRRKA